jgi:hypothetical protein
MKNKVANFSLLLFLLVVFQSAKINSQTISIGNITANPGDNILVPINFTNMNNIGAISLIILYDQTALTFNGVTNIVPEGSGTLANGAFNPARVLVAWNAQNGGVNFPDGAYLEMQFTFLGNSSVLDFTNGCEIADWDANILNVTFTDGSVSAPAVTFNLTVLLEGAYIAGSGGTMSTTLQSSGLLPLTQPYNPPLPYYGNSNPEWLFSGTESVTSFPANSVDWVIVELRDAATAAQATSSTIVARKACLLMSNGSIRALNGTSMPSFFTSITQGAFVVIWHRNHLGIMSSGPVSGVGGTYTYDFTTGSNKVYLGSAGYKSLDSGKWGMAAGDINASNIISSADKNSGWNTDAAKKGYKGADTHLNGQVNNPDKNGFLLTNYNLVSGIPN